MTINIKKENKLCVSISKERESLIVKFPYCDFDYSHCEDYKNIIDIIIKTHNFEVLIIDLSIVRLIDEEAIAAIIYSWSLSCKKDKPFILSSLNEVPKKIIMQKGINKVVEVCDSLEQSLKSGDLFVKYPAEPEKFEEFFGVPLDPYCGFDMTKIKIIKNAISKYKKASYKLKEVSDELKRVSAELRKMSSEFKKASSKFRRAS